MFKIKTVCAYMLGLWLLGMPGKALGQTLAVKTNLLHDALLTPSLGIELATGDYGSLQLSGTYNPFGSSDRKWRNWTVQPEYRWWMHQVMTGPFLGANAIVGGFNIDGLSCLGFADKHRQGTFYGAGICAGWHHIISTRWSLELTLGADFVHTSYDRYDGNIHEGHFTSNLILPTGTGISLVYIIR